MTTTTTTFFKVILLFGLGNWATVLGQVTEYGGSRRENTNCFDRWMRGYRLSGGRPQRVFINYSLLDCEGECLRASTCSAFAYGPSNTTCELSLRPLSNPRDSRSVGNASLPYAEIQQSPEWDVYMYSTARCSSLPGVHQQQLLLPGQQQRAPLYQSDSNYLTPVSSTASGGVGVPIDCFYRLMSGKRLVRPLVTRSITTSGLQQCQEACIEELDCYSISYRYMASGYTYNVANCELSSYYINYEDSGRLKYDFIDDYDYDYFQRERHCKGQGGSLHPQGGGACALITKQGYKLAPTLIKSTHETSTPTQCEFLCSTASRFRCKAFAVRHTARGHANFGGGGYGNRESGAGFSCLLYEVDPSRLPSYDLVPDSDYDVYEMGRLVGNRECVLQGDQYLSRRPGDGPTGGAGTYPPMGLEGRAPPTTTSTVVGQYYPQHSYPPPTATSTGRYPDPRPPPYDDYHSRRPIGGGMGNYGGRYPMRDPYPSGGNYPLDNRREMMIHPSCLIKSKQDFYLAPEVTRATFPTKTLEECRVECVRSIQVLRFSCRMMSFHLTSSQGGSCQLSEYEERDLRAGDYVPSRDRYENAIVLVVDESSGACRGVMMGGQNDGRYGQGGAFGGGRPPFNGDRGYPPPTSTARYPMEIYGKGHASYAPTPSQSYLPVDRGQMDMFGQTVNGERCLRSCVQDREAGFYYCIIDQRGTWDFCCRPDHYCGYSRGLSVPWCYVGSGPTSQVWRSCSQRMSAGGLPPQQQQNIGGLSYLHHDQQPPQIMQMSNVDDVVALSKDVHIKYLKGSLTPPNKSTNVEDFRDVDNNEEMKSSNHGNGTAVVAKERRTAAKSDGRFTLVEV